MPSAALLAGHKHNTINPLLTARRDVDCAQPQALYEHLRYQTQTN